MLDKLEKMTNGNEARMLLYISTYKEASIHNIDSLEASLRTGDLAKIRTIVHSAKPLFTIMGFDELWTRANDIEVAIDTHSLPDALSPKVSRLIHLMNSSLRAIETLNLPLSG